MNLKFITMSKLKFISGIAALALAFPGLHACKDGGKPEEGVNDGSGVNSSPQQDAQIQKGENAGSTAAADEGFATQVIRQYLHLKDALAEDDAAQAANAARELSLRLDALDVEVLPQEKQEKASGILEQARLHAELIPGNGIVEQREQFEQLSINMISLVALTGSDIPLYEQYCPMYNNNKGGVWLSSTEKIQNPYFGSSMLRCGTVRREYN